MKALTRRPALGAIVEKFYTKQADTRIGLNPLKLDHDWYPAMRQQQRCYCGHKKSPGLLTCGEHSLDVKVARHVESLLGGKSVVNAANRRTLPLSVPGRLHRGKEPGRHRMALKIRHEHPELSIRAIARAVGISYSAAWLWLRDRAVTP